MTRLVITVVCIVLIALALLGMRRGWRNRLGRQDDLGPLPEVPDDLGPAVLSSAGLYIGTTYATSWQDRVVHGGLGRRADTEARLYDAGLLLDRAGDEPIFLPAAAWVAARLEPALAGKVMGEGGLLVVRWRLGSTELDTGFRADDKSLYPVFVQAINDHEQDLSRPDGGSV